MPEPYKLLLVGGGKAHVMTLRLWKETAPSSSSSSFSPPSSPSSSPAPPPRPRLALVSESPTSCYSGMLPGVISGAYSPEQALLPLEPLCAAAGFDLIVGKVRRVSSERKEVELEVADGGGKSTSTSSSSSSSSFSPSSPSSSSSSSSSTRLLRLGYETLSLDVGSTAKGGFDARVSERSIAVKPVGSLLERLRPLFEACEAAAAPSPPSSSSPPASLPSVVVVGGGAAGVEIAAAVAARLERAKGKKKEKEKERGHAPPPPPSSSSSSSSSAAAAAPLVSLVTGPRGLLPEESRSAAALVARELRRAGVRVVSGARVVSTPESVFAGARKGEEGRGGTQRGCGVVAVAVADRDGRGASSPPSSPSSSSPPPPPPPLLLLPADFVLWCTGSRPHPWLRDRTDLDLDEEGFVRVDSSLRCRPRRRRPRGESFGGGGGGGGGGDDDGAPPLAPPPPPPPPLPSAFAAGDCASVVPLEIPPSSSTSRSRSPPKSGVYAVRAGEQVLLPNLRAAVEAGGGGGEGGAEGGEGGGAGGGPPPPLPPLRRWSPSRQGRPALSLLSMGNGRAVALWPWRWVPAVAGGWVWLLKDFIDRRWIRAGR